MHTCGAIYEDSQCDPNVFESNANNLNIALEDDSTNKDLAKFNIKLGYPLLLLDENTNTVKSNVLTATIPVQDKIKVPDSNGKIEEALICEITVGTTRTPVEIDESIELDNQEDKNEYEYEDLNEY